MHLGAGPCGRIGVSRGSGRDRGQMGVERGVAVANGRVSRPGLAPSALGPCLPAAVASRSCHRRGREEPWAWPELKSMIWGQGWPWIVLGRGQVGTVPGQGQLSPTGATGGTWPALGTWGHSAPHDLT